MIFEHVADWIAKLGSDPLLIKIMISVYYAGGSPEPRDPPPPPATALL